MDADFAAETANLTRAQILQQAGTAMLAQANAQPNNVLALLRG
jgi:flagellin